MDGSRFGHRERRLLVFAAVGLVVALGGIAAADTAQSGTANVTLYTAADADLADSADVEAAREGGTLAPANGTVVLGETLVAEIESARLASDLADHDGAPTERFFAVLDGAADLRLYQTNAGPNVTPKAIPLGPANTTVYPNGNTTFVSIDTGNVTPEFLPLGDDSAPAATFRGDEQFAVTFGYGVDDPTRGPELRLHLADASFTEHTPVLAPELVNRSVQVNVAPDQELLVRASLANGSVLTKTPEAVPWAETPGVSLDFRNVTPGTNYTLEVVHDGAVVDRQRGVVLEPEARLWDPDVTAVENEDYSAELRINADLSHGGKVIVLDGFGAQVGAARVSPDTETDLTVELRSADPDGTFDPDQLQVEAVRTDGRIEQRYPGTNASLTLDVGEYEWRTTDWEPSPTPGTTSTSGTPASDPSSPNPTETDTPDFTVGEDPSETNSWIENLAAGFGVAGSLLVLGGTGYVLRRRAGR
jgi:hypothetical protein